MQKNFKKSLSVLLAVIMLMCALPIVNASAAEIVLSGNCGVDVTWTLDSEGTLVIKGEGRMDGYGNISGSYSPFYKNTSIKNIIVENGVTFIGSNAFRDCTGLTSIEIPNSVTAICEGAFFDCSSLTSIEIPNGVTFIGSNTFYNTALYNNEANWENDVLYIGEYLIKAKDSISGNYTVKDGTKLIADDAFEDCYNLTSVEIPNSVTFIGSNAFYNTALYNNEANWENDILYIGEYLIKAKTSISGNYTVKDGTKLIADDAFYFCISLTSVEIPNGVTSIGNTSFFRCLHLTSVTIPNSVNYIGGSAFDDCESLTNIVIPDSVITIDDWAFMRCCNLTSVTIGNHVRTIGEYLFRTCYHLTNVTIPDSVISIGRGAFSDCRSLTSIEIPNSVISIGRGAFSDCYNLASIEIPNSVTAICEGAFSGCSSLTDVYYIGSEEQWNQIEIKSSNNYLTNATIHFNSDPNHRPHSHSSAITKPATCISEGVITYTCECGDTYTKSIPVTDNHTYGEWIVNYDATCTREGQKYKTCSVCYDYVYETIPAIGHHNYGEWIIDYPSSCITTGQKHKICSVCYDYVYETIPATGHHNYGEWTLTYPPTCAETGTKEKTCSVCGDTVTETVGVIDHVDQDGDNICDICGKNLTKKTFTQRIQEFFEKIRDFFRRIFGIGK